MSKEGDYTAFIKDSGWSSANFEDLQERAGRKTGMKYALIEKDLTDGMSHEELRVAYPGFLLQNGQKVTLFLNPNLT